MEIKTTFPWCSIFIIVFVLSLFLNFCCLALLYTRSSSNSDELSVYYDNGYSKGYDDGYSIWHDEGYDYGYIFGKEYGLRTGKDAGYEDGYDDGYDEGHQAGYAEANYTPDKLILPTLIEPGTIVHNSKYIGTCPFTVELPDDDQLYYIYLEYVKPSLSSDFAMDQREPTAMSGAYISNLISDLNGDDISFITRANSLDTIQVPPGVYRLWYCSGPFWYDIGDYFGDDTVWYTSDDLLSFYETYTECIGNTITLYKVYGGNFSTYQASETDLPF